MDTKTLLTELAKMIRRRCCEDGLKACRRCSFRKGCVIPVMVLSHRKIQALQDRLDEWKACAEKEGIGQRISGENQKGKE